MPTHVDDTQLRFNLPSIGKKNIPAAFDGDQISADWGVLLLAGADHRLGLIDRLGELIPEHRHPAQITHTMRTSSVPGPSPSHAAIRTPTIWITGALNPPSNWHVGDCRTPAMTSRRNLRCLAGNASRHQKNRDRQGESQHCMSVLSRWRKPCNRPIRIANPIACANGIPLALKVDPCCQRIPTIPKPVETQSPAPS